MTEKQWNAINGADRLASVRRLLTDLKRLWETLPESTRVQLRPIIRNGHVAIVKEDK